MIARFWARRREGQRRKEFWDEWTRRQVILWDWYEQTGDAVGPWIINCTFKSEQSSAPAD